ncbi:hypothetical protein Hanom_Chr02g00160811 [Helianthus anomalus]
MFKCNVLFFVVTWSCTFIKFRPEDIVDLCGVNLYLGSCDSTLLFDYHCVSWALSVCLNVFCCMISQTMWFVCSPICCFAKIVLDVCVCL